MNNCEFDLLGNVPENLFNLMVLAAGAASIGYMLILFWCTDQKRQRDNKRHQENVRNHFKNL